MEAKFSMFEVKMAVWGTEIEFEVPPQRRDDMLWWQNDGEAGELRNGGEEIET